jgi:hypothetical protein
MSMSIDCGRGNGQSLLYRLLNLHTARLLYLLPFCLSDPAFALQYMELGSCPQNDRIPNF